MGVFRSSARLVLDSVYPRFCLICGRNLIGETGAASYLCCSCEPEIEYRAGKNCSVCSKPLISEQKLCLRCRAREYAFSRNISLYSYTGTVRTLLQGYKFEGYKCLAGYFAGKLHTLLLTEFGPLPVVPVPTRRSGKKKRGWDHVETVSRVLNRRYGVQIMSLLVRKGAKAQKKLGYEERLLNMRGAIVPSGKYGTLPEKVILFDDVFTTGATANECSLVLKRMGVVTVYVLTIALD